jgi:peptide deformylase
MERPFDHGSADGAAHPEIVTIGAPMLRQPTQRVEDCAAVGALCEKLVFMLAEINGAGLAANQIGVWQRVMVFQVRKTELHPNRPETPLYIMINPDILEKSEDTIDGWEGCFSVPGYLGLVPRAVRLKCRYNTPDGAEHIEEFEGYAARVIQHECDHLDGHVYLDRMKSMLDFATQGNFKQFQLPRKPAAEGSDAQLGTEEDSAGAQNTPPKSAN